jgi:hypothetical protein
LNAIVDDELFQIVSFVVDLQAGRGAGDLPRETEAGRRRKRVSFQCRAEIRRSASMSPEFSAVTLPKRLPKPLTGRAAPAWS